MSNPFRPHAACRRWAPCGPLASSIHGIFQARILEWVAMSFSRGSSQPRGQTQVSCIAGRFFTNWATRKALIITATVQTAPKGIYGLKAVSQTAGDHFNGFSKIYRAVCSAISNTALRPWRAEPLPWAPCPDCTLPQGWRGRACGWGVPAALSPCYGAPSSAHNTPSLFPHLSKSPPFRSIGMIAHKRVGDYACTAGQGVHTCAQSPLWGRMEPGLRREELSDGWGQPSARCHLPPQDSRKSENSTLERDPVHHGISVKVGG